MKKEYDGEMEEAKGFCKVKLGLRVLWSMERRIEWVSNYFHGLLVGLNVHGLIMSLNYKQQTNGQD